MLFMIILQVIILYLLCKLIIRVEKSNFLIEASLIDTNINKEQDGGGLNPTHNLGSKGGKEDEPTT